MSLEQVSIRVDSRLLHELDQIAHKKYKRRSDIIRDALVDYVERNVEAREVKEIITDQFLEGKIDFDDFSRVVGIDTAEQIKIAKETLEESISRAKKDSKQNS